VNSARGGGSITFGLDETKRPLPQGLEPRAVAIRDILQTLGMSAEFRNEWHVTSVSSNSAAERSGVKVGDVIVAVDDRELNAGSAFHGSGSFSTVKVRRGGKLIPIKIK
jgi:S1-C subfamily serine protease